MKSFPFLAGITILSIITVITIIGPYLPFIDKELTETRYVIRDSGEIDVPPFPPSKEYPLGSDERGVDLLSRLVIGAKETLLLVGSIVVIRFLGALLLGVGAFYFRGIRVILSIWHQLFSYIPTIFFVVLLIGIPFFLFSINRPFWFVIILALIEVGRVGDMVYRLVKEVASKPFYEAGIVAGGSPFGLSIQYLFPNIRTQLIAIVSNELGRTLFLLAQLGVVGIFINVAFENDASGSFYIVNQSDSWPQILSTILKDMWSTRIVPFSTITVLMLTVLSFYLVGNGLIRKLTKR